MPISIKKLVDSVMVFNFRDEIRSGKELFFPD